MVMKRGGVRLRDWLREERRTQEWLAEQIGSHQTNISAWIRGRPIPLEAAVAIERLTGIEVEDWTVEAAESGPAGVLSSTGT
jgi:plasmid maintenance system antidote protein VapI